jgi:transcriptional regulator with XRE-family HTH domain
MRKNLFLDTKGVRSLLWGKSKVIAEQMSINPVTLSKKINGQTPITLKEVNALAEILGVDTLAILRETYDAG